jgi:hypothetical protein
MDFKLTLWGGPGQNSPWRQIDPPTRWIKHFSVLVIWIVRLKYPGAEPLPIEQARLDILKIHVAFVNKGGDTSAT